jgi:hypothetical protein
VLLWECCVAFSDVGDACCGCCDVLGGSEFERLGGDEGFVGNGVFSSLSLVLMIAL